MLNMGSTFLLWNTGLELGKTDDFLEVDEQRSLSFSSYEAHKND